MKKITIITLIILNLGFICKAQQNSNQTLDDLKFSLKDYIRDWSCTPFIEGSFTENIEIFIYDNKLIIKKNYSKKETEILGTPEYSKTIIDPITIIDISVQQNDKSCAGIIIKTNPEGIKVVSKYKNNESEVPMHNEKGFRESFGWRNDLIRINKNEHFNKRSNVIIETLTNIFVLLGNTTLKQSNLNVQRDSKDSKTATGFAITSNGLIATNYHLIENANSIRVRGINSNFEKTFKAKIVVSDKKNDLALIQIEDSSFKSLGVIPYTFKKGLLGIGENVFSLVYPPNAARGNELKLTNGIITSQIGIEGDVSSYQISSPIFSGNYGAPLFDSKGFLIGVISSQSTSEKQAYALKITYLTNLIELLPSPPKLQNTNILTGKTLAQQTEILRKFTYIIETE